MTQIVKARKEDNTYLIVSTKSRYILYLLVMDLQFRFRPTAVTQPYHHIAIRLLLESICNKPEVIQANIRSVKISSPDVCIPLNVPDVAYTSMKHVYLHTYHPCSTLAGIRNRLLKILRYMCVGNWLISGILFLFIVDYRNELNNIWPHTKR